jgi:hypothetical protein
MSRIASGNTVVVRPTNNVYTGLAFVAVVVQLIGLVVLFISANAVGGLF